MMRKFGVVVVKPRNKGRGFAFLCNKSKKNWNLSCLIEENKEEDCWGDVVESFRNIGNWEEVCNEGK